MACDPAWMFYFWVMLMQLCALQAPAEEQQEEAETGEKEVSPVRVFPPQTKLDVQAPRTPSKRSKHPSKASTEPATKRTRCNHYPCLATGSVPVLKTHHSSVLRCYATIAAAARCFFAISRYGCVAGALLMLCGCEQGRGKGVHCGGARGRA